jgi:2-succinyl-6-hydroxy-2,4-cyclohexadiene-1-carboxylate synthase
MHDASTIHVTTDDGVRLEVDRRGSGPAFVMVHGFTGAKDDFADHAPRFAEHLTVVTFDHRGHGRSGAPDDAGSYSLDCLAADTLAIADALELDTFRLLGHSMGGMVARRVVLAHPERVDGLVLMATSPGPPPSVDPSLADVAADLALGDGMTVLREVLDAMDPLGSDADRRVRRERPGYEELMAWKWAHTSPYAYAGLVRDILTQPGQLAVLRTVTCPTLVVVGDEDTTFLDDANRIADTVPGSRLVVVPDAGHSPQFENPETWFRAVDGFLRALPAREAA